LAEQLKELEAQFDEAMKKGDRALTKKLSVDIHKLEEQLASKKVPVTLMLDKTIVQKLRSTAAKDGQRGFAYLVEEALEKAGRWVFGPMGVEETKLSVEGETLFQRFLTESNPVKANELLNGLTNEELETILIHVRDTINVTKYPESTRVLITLPLEKVERIYETLKVAAQSRGVS